MEKIEVSAHFNARGQIKPVSFVREGNTYRVDSVGRTWTAKDGLHILVMTAENRVFHLLFIPQEGSWYLLRGSENPNVHMV
jgi:hypothetical protein